MRALVYQSLMYASTLIPEIGDTPKPLDDAMRWGFSHQAGPFETWDLLDVAETAAAMAAAGFPPAAWVEQMLLAGGKSFYQYVGGGRRAVYCPSERRYVPIL